MFHLSCLLLNLQFCYLFICFFHFHFLLFSIFILIHHTTQIQFSQCSINLQWFTYLVCSFISNFVTCSFVSLIFISFSFSFSFLFITTQPQYSQCSINLQWFTYLACSFCSNFVICSFVHFIFISLLFFIFSLIHHHSATEQSMYYWPSMLHLSCQLLQLQFRYLFIWSFHFQFILFFIFLIHHYSDTVHSMYY